MYYSSWLCEYIFCCLIYLSSKISLYIELLAITLKVHRLHNYLYDLQVLGHTVCQYAYIRMCICIYGLMVSVRGSSAVDRWFET
jgi:hypothetical protein